MLKKIPLFILGLLIFTATIAMLRPSLVVPKALVRKELEQPNSKYFSWKGNMIHYVDEGQGIPVLMIHGFGGSHYNFQKLSELMKDKYRVIRVDLPGFGLSDFPKDEQDYATMYRSFVADFVNRLEIDSVYVMGNSMGGGIAWLYTLDHPEKVKGLVLLDAFGYDAEVIRKEVLRGERLSFLSPFLKKGLPITISRKTQLQCYEDDSMVNDDVVNRSNRFWNAEGNIDAFLSLASYSNFPTEENIKKILTPTLIVWGKQDAIIPAEHATHFHQDIKNSTVVLLDHCGHVPMAEKPDCVLQAFVSFEKSLK